MAEIFGQLNEAQLQNTETEPSKRGQITFKPTVSRPKVYDGATSKELAYTSDTANLQTQISAITFNSLSPMTTGGDLIYGGASGAGTRLPNGTLGQVLTSNGGTNAPSWTTISASFGAVQLKTANYTVVNTDGYLIGDATSSAFTFTLYAASGNVGKILTITKTDSSANSITVDANASETINGALTLILSAENESVTIYCDGSNWKILAVSPTTEKSSATTTDTAFPITVSEFGDLTSISLPIGTWDLSCHLVINNNGAVTPGGFAVGISTTSGNFTTGLLLGVNRLGGYNNGVDSSRQTLTISAYRVKVTSTTTYYLKSIADATVNWQATWSISAKKVGF